MFWEGQLTSSRGFQGLYAWTPDRGGFPVRLPGSSVWTFLSREDIGRQATNALYSERLG